MSNQNNKKIIPALIGYEVSTSFGSKFERSDTPIEIKISWQEKGKTQGEDKEGRILTTQTRFLK